MSIHICIVSERLLANLIPALMERPEMVYLPTTEEMARGGQADRLRKLLLGQALQAEICPGLPSGGLSGIYDFVIELSATVQRRHPGAEVVLNITGGNKLMTLAFFDLLRDVADRVVYTDTEHGVVEHLPVGAAAPEHPAPMESVLDVPLYLGAQGMTLRRAASDDPARRERSDARKGVTKFLAGEAGRIGDFLGALNRLACLALDERGETLTMPRQCFQSRPWGRWRETVAHLQEAGLVAWDRDSTIEFPDAETARHLGGGWLEEYAWQVARDESPDDVRMGAEGTWDDTRGARNELDLVVVHSNRMLLVECKTLRLGRDASADDDLLYKLDSLSDDVKGLFGETLLLSARVPTRAMLDRAAHQRIRILGPEQLGDLRGLVRHWMANGHLRPV